MNGDTLRQAANAFGAVFQIVAGPLGAFLYGVDIGEVSRANDTLVVPAGYAFAIWGPIFALSLAYAVYQALPSRREDELLRRIGPYTAAAYLLAGTWSLVFPGGLFVPAQLVILGVFACAVTAFVRVARYGQPPSRGVRWLVALPVGLLAGWVTAATFVGFATTLVGLGVLTGGTGEAVLGAVLLLVGGSVAAATVAAASGGPAQGTLAYGLAVLWALVAVVANQLDASLLTTSAAVIAAVPVSVALLSALARGPREPSGGGAARPRVV